MNNYLPLLQTTTLFAGLSAAELSTLLSRLGGSVRSYGKGEALVLAGEPSRRVGIVLSGEIYMCRPKRVGTVLQQGSTVAVVGLSKAIMAVKTPVAGTVVQINPALQERPDLVHRDPYGEGWIARLRLTDFAADAAALVHGDAVAAAMARDALHHGHLIEGGGAADTPPTS